MEIDLDSVNRIAEKTVEGMTAKMKLMSLSVICSLAIINVEHVIQEKKEEDVLHSIQDMCFALLLYMKNEGFDIVQIEKTIREELNIDKIVQETILDNMFKETLQYKKGDVHEC